MVRLNDDAKSRRVSSEALAGWWIAGWMLALFLDAFSLGLPRPAWLRAITWGGWVVGTGGAAWLLARAARTAVRGTIAALRAGIGRPDGSERGSLPSRSRPALRVLPGGSGLRETYRLGTGGAGQRPFRSRGRLFLARKQADA